MVLAPKPFLAFFVVIENLEVLKSHKLLKLLENLKEKEIENLEDLRDPSSWGCGEDDVKNEIDEFIEKQSMTDKEIEYFKRKILQYDKLLRNARKAEDSGMREICWVMDCYFFLCGFRCNVSVVIFRNVRNVRNVRL